VYFGRGQMPMATAVMADVLEIARARPALARAAMRWPGRSPR
jgi:hypothetical protein